MTPVKEVSGKSAFNLCLLCRSNGDSAFQALNLTPPTHRTGGGFIEQFTRVLFLVFTMDHSEDVCPCSVTSDKVYYRAGSTPCSTHFSTPSDSLFSSVGVF